MVLPPTMLIKKRFKYLSKHIVQLKQNSETAVQTGSKWCRFHNAPRQIIPPTRGVLSSLISVLHFILHLILNPHLPDIVFIKVRLTKLLTTRPLSHTNCWATKTSPLYSLLSLSKSCSPHIVILLATSSPALFFVLFFEVHFKNRLKFYYWVSQM